MKPFDTDEVVDLIRNEAESLDDVKIYYALRKYKFKPIRPTAMQTIRVCLAIDKVGIPITTYLVACVQGGNRESASLRLHALGDKHILVLKRKLGHRYLEWVLHHAFKKLIE